MLAWKTRILTGNIALSIFILLGLGLFELSAEMSPMGQASSSWSDVNGVPEYRYYEPEVIGSHTGINSLSLDDLGRLLIASGQNIISFDGNVWVTHLQHKEQVLRPENIFVTVLAPNGEVYCSTDIGLFKVRFTSDNRYKLLPLLSDEKKNAAIVQTLRQGLVSGTDIYFYGMSDIVRYDTLSGELDIFSDIQTIASITVVGGMLQVFTVNGDWLGLTGDKWEKLNPISIGGSREAVRAVHGWGDEGLLMAPDGGGILTFKNGKTGVWRSEIQELETNRILTMESISRDYLAVSVDARGIFILNRDGLIVQSLSRMLDYRFGEIRHLLHVGNGTIWAATGNTLLRVGFLNPLTEYSVLLPYSRAYATMFAHNEELYVVSDQKLARMEHFSGGALKKYDRKMPDGDFSILSGLSVKGGILCAGYEGVAFLRDDGIWEAITEFKKSNLLIPDPVNEDNVIVGGADHFYLLERLNGIWEYRGVSIESQGYCYFWKTDKYGNIWVEQGAGNFSLINVVDKEIQVRAFGKQDGVRPQWVNIWNYRDKLLFGAGIDERYLVWNEDTRQFSICKDGFIQGIQDEYHGVSRPGVDTFGNLWVPTSSVHPVFRRQEDGSNLLDLRTLRGLSNESLVQMIPGENGIVWILGESKIYRYNPFFNANTDTLPATRILQVESAIDNELLLDNRYLGETHSLEVPYRQNELLVRVSTPTVGYDLTVGHEYMMDGRSVDWTTFPAPNTLPLGHLYEGDYRLRIRSVSNQEIGEEIVLDIKVHPPVYRSLYAYLLYLILSFLLIGYTLYFVKRVEHKKSMKLQQLVDYRTRELKVANEDLLQLVSKAESATKAKNAFLQGVSHEMCTPLNGMLGPAEMLLQNNSEHEQISLIEMIRTSGSQLLCLVEGVLSFVENEANPVAASKAPFDIKVLIEELYQEFEHKSNELNIELKCDVEGGMSRYWIGDSIKIRQSLRILMDNAFKFTETGSIHLRVLPADMNGVEKWIAFELIDTGIGIDEAIQETLFEPFEQGSRRHGTKHRGPGIGLSIFKQLSISLGGQIDVKSAEGAGSIFRLVVPLKQAHDAKARA